MASARERISGKPLRGGDAVGLDVQKGSQLGERGRTDPADSQQSIEAREGTLGYPILNDTVRETGSDPGQ